MDRKELLDLLGAVSVKTPSIAACIDALKSGVAQVIGTEPGHGVAWENLATFQIRRRVAQEAGIEIPGLDELLESLAECRSDEPLLVIHLGTIDRTFTIMIEERTKRVLGCIRLERKR